MYGYGYVDVLVDGWKEIWREGKRGRQGKREILRHVWICVCGYID